MEDATKVHDDYEVPLSELGYLQRLSSYVLKLRLAFGDRFLVFMGVTYFGLKGVVLTLMQTAQLPLFRGFGVSADKYQLAQMITMTPWAMKGWLGVLSDCAPLGKYNKRGYLVLTSLLGMIACAGLLCMLIFNIAQGLWTAAAMFFFVMVCASTFDLLCEGKYTEIMRRRGSGAGEVSFVWTNVMLGGVLSSLVVLFFVDKYGPLLLFAISMPILVLMAGLTMLGFMPEEPLKSRGIQWTKVKSEPGLFSLASCMGLGALVVNVSAAFLPSHWQITLAVGVSLGLIIMSSKTLSWTLAKSNLYLFLNSMVYLSIDGPLQYWYTADEECVPGGPSFDYGYYLAITNLFGGVFGIIGSLLFQCIQSWSFRSAFRVTTVVQSIAAIFDLIIVRRWNLLIGVSDKAMFLFGDAACQQIAQMLLFMPGVLLTSLLCPRGAEATVYAILAGFQNFGANISQALGVWLIRELGIKAGASGGADACDYSRLDVAIVISHIVLPICILPLTYCLIPDVKMNDENAFEAVSPPPSFRSPGSSVASSEANSPRSPYIVQDESKLYDPLLEDVVMTGLKLGDRQFSE